MGDSGGSTISTDIEIETIFDTVDWSKVPAPPDFDEAAYLAEFPDVAEKVTQGDIRSGFEHYMRWGRGEGRQRPFPRR